MRLWIAKDANFLVWTKMMDETMECQGCKFSCRQRRWMRLWIAKDANFLVWTKMDETMECQGCKFSCVDKEDG